MLAVEGQEKPKRPGQHRSRSMRRVAKFIRRTFNLVSKLNLCSIDEYDCPFNIFIAFG